MSENQPNTRQGPTDGCGSGRHGQWRGEAAILRGALDGGGHPVWDTTSRPAAPSGLGVGRWARPRCMSREFYEDAAALLERARRKRRSGTRRTKRSGRSAEYEDEVDLEGEDDLDWDDEEEDELDEDDEDDYLEDDEDAIDGQDVLWRKNRAGGGCHPRRVV